jgi:hypothetical protein
VLSYDAGPAETTVRIYSAAHRDLVFASTRDLATRKFGADDIFLGSNMQLRHANDIAIPGDYVGLQGAGSHIAAGFVLPENDDCNSRLTGYAAVFNCERSR